MHVSFNKAMENMNKSLLIIPLFSAVFFVLQFLKRQALKSKGKLMGTIRSTFIFILIIIKKAL